MGVLGDPSLLTFLVAALLWVVVAWVPGALVLSALAPWSSFLQRLAAAPLVSIGVGFSVGAWVQRAGTRGAVDVVLGALVVASIVALVVVLRRRPHPGPRLRARCSTVPTRWSPRPSAWRCSSGSWPSP